MTKVLGLCGSLRQGSRTWQAIRFALAGAKRGGAEIDGLRGRALEFPIFDPDLPLEAHPAGVATFLEKVRAADAVILATPVYHGTVSGLLKNAVDYLELGAAWEQPYLAGKVCGLICVSGRQVNETALDAMQHIARALHCVTLPRVASVPRGAFDEAGQLVDVEHQRRLAALGANLVMMAARLAPPAPVSRETLLYNNRVPAVEMNRLPSVR
jgi:FMN reductase